MRRLCSGLILLAAIAVLSAIHVAAQNGEIQLPKPVLSGKLSVESALLSKKSVRNFTGQPVTMAQLSQLLWAANGNLPTDAISGATYKVIPSAGGLYPLEVFVVIGKGAVDGVAEGVYSYDPKTNSLRMISAGDNRTLLSHACLSQMWLAKAPVLLVIGAVFERMTARYGSRGLQYVYMEAGMSNQNLYLQAEALGLKIGTVGAFNDAQVSAVLKLPQAVTPLLVVGVGK